MSFSPLKHFLLAIGMGIVGTAIPWLYEWLIECIQWLLTDVWSPSRLAAFEHIPMALKISTPTLGGLLSGYIILKLHANFHTKPVEFTEVLAGTQNVIPTAPSYIKLLAESLSIGSGAAIGKSGAIIQSGAIVASSLAQYLKASARSHQLFVACAAAAGFTVVFHTPLSGALFVLEVVVGSLNIRLFGTLLVATTTSYLLLLALGNALPIYMIPISHACGIFDLFFCALLGILASLAAQLWARLLKWSYKLLKGPTRQLPIRLASAGLVVGLVSCLFPAVVGNGEDILADLLHGSLSHQEALLMLAVKGLAVSIVLGCGTIGGVMTPSLLVGAIIGFLFGGLLHKCALTSDLNLVFALVGMVAFFSTASNAPLTSLVLGIEFSLSTSMIYPLMIGVGAAFCTALVVKAQPLEEFMKTPQRPNSSVP
jgi:CIC family chloride channel protein